MRAAAGTLAFSAVLVWQCAMAWIALPHARAWLTAGQLALYVVCTVVASMVFYWFAVMLAAFLDEFWVANGTLVFLFAVLQVRLAVPEFARFDVFRAMGDLSYAATGCMPWGRLAACAVLSLVFAAAAIRIVDKREY